MKNKLLSLIFTIIIFLSFFSNIITVNSKFVENKSDDFIKNQIINKAYLEEKEDIKILFLNGSHYEMGYQHGYLLKYDCLENIRAFIHFAKHIGYTYEQLLDSWKKMEGYVPQDYIDEMQGMADGIDVDFNDIAATYAVLDCCNILNCFGLAAWDTATLSNKLIHLRSIDLPLNIKDPITGKHPYENSILIVRKPENKYASLIPSIASFLNCGGGINENGIGLSCQLSWSKDQTLNGLPLKIREQKILDHSLTANDAINIIITNKTLGNNYIISDSKTPIGYAVETTANLTYIGTWNNSVESNNPFYSIKNVVRRTNFFIDPEIAASQRNHYHPGGFIGLFKAFISLILEKIGLGANNFFNPNLIFPIWWSYKIFSKEIVKKWGQLDLENTMLTLRSVYNAKTNLFLSIMKKQGRGHGFLESWGQWVACPETGDMFVSFASKGKYASQNPVYHFNLFELLEG